MDVERRFRREIGLKRIDEEAGGAVSAVSLSSFLQFFQADAASFLSAFGETPLAVRKRVVFVFAIHGKFSCNISFVYVCVYM